MAIALSGSLILSGSIIVSGSITSTGTISMSGSIASSSYALNATTFNGLASSIFATTGSNTFIGNQVVSGSLTTSGSITATGTITAQTLVIQTITSSTVYSSGSNIFGNALANTQTFTGSVLVTGSLTIAGASSATSYSGTTLYGSTAICSPVGKFTTCIDAGSGIFSGNIGITVANTPEVLLTHSNTSKTFLMAVDGSNAFFRANSTNNILFQYAGGTTALTINGSTGAATFACSVTAGGYGAFTAGANGSPVLTLGTAGAVNAVINTADEMFFNIDSNNDQGGARFVFGTNRTGTTGGSDLVIFSENGSVSIGGSCPNATYLQLGDWCNRDGRILTSNAAGWVGDGKAPLMVITSGNDTSTCKGNAIGLALHNDSQTCGSYTPALVFSRRSYSGTYNSSMAAIVAQSSLCGVDSNWNGGDLVFSTTPNSGYMTESMRIISSGKIGIGATSPNWLLEICCNTAATGGGGYPAISINNPNDAGYSAYYFFKGSTNMGGLELSNATCHLFVNTACTFAISTNNTERLRVTNCGAIAIGRNDVPYTNYKLITKVATDRNIAFGTQGTDASIEAANDIFSANVPLRIYGSPLYLPNIYADTTGTGANVVVGTDGRMQRSTSSSKYKNNIQDYTKGLVEVMQMRPVIYNSKNEDETQTYAGLIAEEIHELGLTEFVQYAEDGTPDALAYQNMIALAFKAIQELNTKIIELEKIVATK
jgi:hypothetical protein